MSNTKYKLVFLQQRPKEYLQKFSEVNSPAKFVYKTEGRKAKSAGVIVRRPGEMHGFLTANVIKKDGTVINISREVHNLLTQDGRDFYHNQCLIETAANTTKGANQIGVTENTSQTLDATQTALTGEITTNGLGRSNPSATVSHTDNSNSTTIEHTFTAGAAFTDVVRSALFNAATSGIMTHIAAFATGSGTLASGDTLKVTWTINIG